MEDVTLLWVDARLNKSRGSLFYDFQVSDQWHISEHVAHACSMTKRVRPAVIVFDFDYADITGLKALRQVREECPPIPLLMLTEQHYEGLSIWALRCRVWDYLIKPLDTDDFMQHLEMVVTGKTDRETGLTWLRVLPSNRIPREASFIGENSMGLGARTAIRYIESHLDEKISAHDISQQCGLTRYELSRAFKSEYGITFRECLRKLRMQRARRLLGCTQASITDIALSVGFNDLSHFSRVFHRFFGCSPRTFRSEHCVTNHGADVNIHNFDEKRS